MTGPTPAQRAELARSQQGDRRALEALVDVYACDRLNGGDRVVMTALLFDKLSAGTPGALASLVAAAVDRLAEMSWESK